MVDRPGLKRSYRKTANWRGPLRQRVLKKFGYACALASIECSAYGPEGRGLLLSHIVPERLGGPNTEENLIPLCARHSGRTDGGRRYQ